MLLAAASHSREKPFYAGVSLRITGNRPGTGSYGPTNAVAAPQQTAVIGAGAKRAKGHTGKLILNGPNAHYPSIGPCRRGIKDALGGFSVRAVAHQKTLVNRLASIFTHADELAEHDLL